MTSGVSRRTQTAVQVLAVIGLAVFYLLTAPWYHTTAVDSYHYAALIEQEAYTEPSPRHFLWVAAMHALYDAVAVVSPGLDSFLVVGVLNAILTALAVVLLQNLLRRHFAFSAQSSWLTAALFAVSYGTWRYATELEVYAASALLSLLILHLVFRVPAIAPDRRTRAVLVAATVGALATLAYQPLGIVAGLAVLPFLAFRFRFRDSALYLGVYGLFVGTGTMLIRLVQSPGSIWSVPVLDTDDKALVVPELVEVGFAAAAFLQNVLSVNWIFLFEPTRARLAADYRYSFIQELVASEHSYLGNALYVLTLPAAAVLVAVAFVLALRRTHQPAITAVEGCMLVWLVIHGAMALALHPEGFETWLPALPPLLILAGIRVVQPLVVSGRQWIPVLTVAILLVHNWFSGVAVMALADRDYNLERGGPVLAEARPGDLLVLGNDWALERYLNYTGEAQTLLIHRDGAEAFASAADATLANGGRVFIFDDTFEELPEALQIVYLLRAVEEPGRLGLGEHGYALELGAAAR